MTQPNALIEATADHAMINYEDEFARITAETSLALVPPKGNYISIKNKQFTLPDQTTYKEIECIVLDFVRLNVLMPPYVPNVRAGAKCWAIGRNEKTLTPAENAPDPQCESCELCPNNQFGSRGKGKLCTNRNRLIVVPPNATPDTELWILQLPPTSLATWSNYVKRLEREVGPAGFCRAVTRIAFDTGVDFSKLMFSQIKEQRVENPGTILALRASAHEALYLDPPTE